jgi:hypothetical protein
MKTRGFVVIMFAVALSFAPQFVDTSSAAEGEYSAQLISPTAGQVLYPGQKVKVEWKSVLPNIEVQFCEMEIFLSLDGGTTWPACITPILDPRTQFFYWTVPNIPTNAAVLDIRFGCERWYRECYSPQTASTFVIRPSAGEFY